MWLAAFVGLLMAVTLSRSPAVPTTPPPTARDALAMRAVFERVRDLGDTKTPTPLAISWAELSAAAGMAGRAASLPHVQLARSEGEAVIKTSLALPFGFWVNAKATVEGGEAGEAIIRGQIGHLPIPAFIMRGLISTARTIIKWRGVEVPAVDDVISKVTVSDAGVSASLNLPRNSGLFQTLRGLRPDPIRADAVLLHYCRLVALERAAPSAEFSVHVARAFAGAADSSRARLVALAMVVVSPEVGQLVGSQASLTKGCVPIRADAKLNNRLDLAKHWALSAALSASVGPDASMAMGVWKEVADSGRGGSGFSYADLAADRAGMMVAQRLADPSSAPVTHKWLANVTPTQLLPIEKLALAEGMSEAEFSARYKAVDSARDKAMIARIDGALNAALP
jgi:uncharacterized protein YfiM (DUF2279 family)